MIWTGHREKWLRKNGINIEGKITSFKTVSTPSSAGEYIDVKHLVVEIIVDGKKRSFLSRGLYPEKEYRIPNLGENIDIYYKKGNPTVYFVDVSRLKNTP